ncbi:MAG: RDD family protein [Bacteroidota bacterium]
MRTLEIVTSQNVAIDYNLANIGERGVALVIDVVIMTVLVFALVIVEGFVVPNDYIEVITYSTSFIVISFYTLVSEISMNGQSWGKKITGLKVVKINGTEARLSDYLVRWAFRSVDIYLTFTTLGIIMINSTVKSQRLGDMLANTAVVKIKPERKITLANIESLKNKSTHIIRYKEVVHMNEKEMLVLKSALDQAKQNPNQAHTEALALLSAIMKERLHINNEEKSDREFLQKLINDYIVLTR